MHELEIGVGRHEILADSFNCPASRFGLASGLDQGRQNRADRVGENYACLRRVLRHVASDTAQRAARADTDHDGIDVALHLAKNLRAGRGLVGLRIGWIGELIDDEPTAPVESLILLAFPARGGGALGEGNGRGGRASGRAWGEAGHSTPGARYRLRSRGRASTAGRPDGCRTPRTGRRWGHGRACACACACLA